MEISGRVRSALTLLDSVLREESSVSTAAAAATATATATATAATDRSLANLVNAGSRNFASQEKTPSHSGAKVPLSFFGGSGNYASALFLAASKANLLDKVESEILDIVEASRKSLLFSQFIKDLSVPRETRVKACWLIMEVSNIWIAFPRGRGESCCHNSYCSLVSEKSASLIGYRLR